jgi:hypothetical protein
MTTTTEKSAIEEVTDHIYSYVRRSADKHKYRLYFTDSGLARLTSIEGYLAALADTGHELAEALANDFYQNLDNLVGPRNVTFNVAKDETIEVPARKCLLHDDGTKHGFSLLWLYPVDPKRYDECVERHRKVIREREAEYAKTHRRCAECGHQEYLWGETSHELAVKSLNIRERVDPHARYSEEITDYRYAGGQQVKIYYTVGMNGGLIYHGPGAGQTFTTNIGNTFWGIHS